MLVGRKVVKKEGVAARTKDNIVVDDKVKLVWLVLYLPSEKIVAASIAEVGGGVVDKDIWVVSEIMPEK